MSLEQKQIIHEAESSKGRVAAIVGAASIVGLTALLASNPFEARGEEVPQEVPQGSVPCDPNMEVCVPGITAPPDAEPASGNPKPGETIPIDPYFDDKGGDLTTTVPATTVPVTTTTVVVTTAPPSSSTLPTLPPITIVVPPSSPEHTN